MFSSIKKYFSITLFTVLCTNAAFAHDILVEGKVAAFLPTDQTVKDIYGTSGEFGFEITGEIVPHVYGFASFDFISKSGTTEIFETPTKMYTSCFGIGLKYFIPVRFGDFYVGLGAEPTYLHTLNQSQYAEALTNNWSFGGIAKVGAIVNLPDSFFLDFFVDYSFVHFDFIQSFNNPVQSTSAVLNGVLFGMGFGYRFN